MVQLTKGETRMFMIGESQKHLSSLRTSWHVAVCSCLLSLLTIELPAETPDWIQTARVFLIDAYYPPFAPQLEFDAEALAKTMADMNVNTVRMATMGKYATIQGVRFSTHPDQGKRDLLQEMIDACKPRGIRVVPYISTGHKLAWSMVTKDYPEYAQRTRPDGGPVRSHMFVGEDHGTICWNTPYRRAYMDLLEHVVRDYDVDGLYFDTWRPQYFWPGLKLCYCEGCRRGFRKATGHEIPWHEREEDYTPKELAVIDQYHAWYRDELVEIMGEVRRLVKTYKDIPLIYNINNPRTIATEDPRVIEAMDAFLYERGQSMLERAEGVSLARAAGLGVWPYVGVYNNWPRVIYNGINWQQQIFATAMFGGAPIIAQPNAFVEHAESREFVRYPFEVLKKHEREFEGFSNVPYVAVVYGYENPKGHAKAGNWWKADARTATLGAFAACLYGHVQVTSMHQNLLDAPARLARYRVLYLADITHLSQQRVRNIQQFVRNGGGLIVSYATSLYGSDGKRQARFGLEDLIRVKPVVPRGELADVIRSYQIMTGGPNDLYLLARPNAAPIGQEWAGRLVPVWFFEPVEVLDGGTVIMDIVTGDGRRPILPGLVFSKYGKGRVVYLSSSIESLYLDSGFAVLGELIKTLIEMVAPKPPPYSLDAPSGLIANLTVNGDHRVLHMTNWTGNKLERSEVNDYYLAPIENVRARIRIPDGKRVQSVTTLVEGACRKRVRGNILEVSFTRIDAYQAVFVVFE